LLDQEIEIEGGRPWLNGESYGNLPLKPINRQQRSRKKSISKHHTIPSL